MNYISTRGGISPITFREAVMMGLGTDGGLLLPESLPRADEQTLAAWRHLSYQDLAFEVMSLFITDIPAADLRGLISRSYASFSHPEVTPLTAAGDVHVLELFHGPTLAFKDVALQFLGNIFEYILKQEGGRLNILGATSGDTGSAAIYGVRGRERINIFIIHPHKRVSEVQELQMTTVTDPNVFNIAVRGTFDDGQAIIKTIFNDIEYKKSRHLGAVNSINWARILAQVVYYIYACLRVAPGGGRQQVDFAVPTGNFGDIFAGFVARRLVGGRIRRLVLATNENDLLARFILQGEYSVGRVVQTSSPSMDIQVASNFERYLYYLNDKDPGKTGRDMTEFARTGLLVFPDSLREQIRLDFAARSVNEAETLATIRDFYKNYSYILDPHTAVGVNAGLSLRDADVPMVCLATAHPAKFEAAVRRAIARPPDIPEALAGLKNKETRCRVLDADPEAVRSFIDLHARN